MENNKVFEVHRNLLSVDLHVDFAKLRLLPLSGDLFLVNSNQVGHVVFPTFPIISSLVIFASISSIQAHFELHLPVQKLFFLLDGVQHFLLHHLDLDLCGLFGCFLLLFFDLLNYRFVHQMLSRHLFFTSLRVDHLGELIFQRIKQYKLWRTIIWLNHDDHRIRPITLSGLKIILNPLSLFYQTLGLLVIYILSSFDFLNVMDYIAIHVYQLP